MHRTFARERTRESPLTEISPGSGPRPPVGCRNDSLFSAAAVLDGTNIGSDRPPEVDNQVSVGRPLLTLQHVVHC